MSANFRVVSGGQSAEDLAFQALYDAVKKGTGIDLGEYKQDQLRRRLLTWAQARNETDMALLGRKLAADPKEMRALLDRVSINVSELYRNPERWTELETKILSKIQHTGVLRCWSAGCSFGAEAHTMASVLENKGVRFSIVGTDIDEDALQSARSGRFDSAAMRGVPQAIKEKFFTALPNGDWQAKDNLRKNLKFQYGNLLEGKFEQGFDLILCRNVVIYFNDEAKDRLYRRFYESLRPGGILFVGGTERIFDSKAMGYESPLPFFYQKPVGAQDSWRNAS